MWAVAKDSGLVDDNQDSCRMIVSKFMCNEDGNLDCFAPSLWAEKCSTGECKNCPPPDFPVPSTLAGTNVIVSLWSQKEVAPGRRKYGLWKVVKPIEEFSADLSRAVVTMKRHIFTAAVCWGRLSLAPSCLCLHGRRHSSAAPAVASRAARRPHLLHAGRYRPPARLASRGLRGGGAQYDADCCGRDMSSNGIDPARHQPGRAEWYLGDWAS